MTRSHNSAGATVGAPRILLLSPAFPPAAGGIERTAGALAAGLRDGPLEVVSSKPPARSAMSPPPGVRVHWAHNDPPYGRRATAALQRQAVRVGAGFAPDVVLVLHVRAAPAARMLALARGARVVLVVHAKELREQPRLSAAAVGWADQIVAVSRFSHDLALEAGAEPSRLSIIHPGVSLPSTPPPAVAQRPGPPTIITVARMSDPHKGHDTALAAMEYLRARVPDAVWVMVGDGDLRDQLREQARRRGLQDSVRFPGSLTDAAVAQLLRSAHAFCMLSRQPAGSAAGEGFGIVFVEAGAQGLPVLAGDVPGVVDAVLENETGLLVDSRNPRAASAALERILLDGELAARLGAAGRKRALSLSWDTVVNRYRTVIAQALASPPPTRGWASPAWAIDLVRGPRTAEAHHAAPPERSWPGRSALSSHP